MADLQFSITADDNATPVVQDVKVSFQGLAEEIGRAMKGASKEADKAGDNIRKALNFSGGVAKNLLVRPLQFAASLAVKGIGLVFSGLTSIVGGAFSAAVAVARGILNGLVGIVKGVVSAIGTVIEGIAGAFGLVFNKVTAIVAAAGTFIAVKLSQQAAEFESLDRALQNLAVNAGTSAEAIRRAIERGSKGTVNQIDAMRLANQALLLGVAKTPEEFETLSQTALVLGQAMGIDLTRALESLIVGIGRQSKLWLDNLGIIIDTEKAYNDFAAELKVDVKELDDLQKKQAFTNATLAQGLELVKRAGGAVEGLSVNFAQLGVALQDTYTDLARLVAPSILLVVNEIKPLVEQVRAWAQAQRDVVAGQLAEYTAKIIEKVKELPGLIIEWKNEVLALIPVVREQLSEAWEKVQEKALVAWAYIQRAIQIGRSEWELFLGALKGEGFNAELSVIVQAFRLLGAEIELIFARINRAISLSFGDLIAQMENRLATLRTQFAALGSPTNIVGGIERLIGRTFGDEVTFQRGTERIQGNVQLPRPTNADEVAARSERQLQAAIEQRDNQRRLLDAVVGMADGTERTMRDLIELQILQIQDAEERARLQQEFQATLRDLQGQVRSLPGVISPVIVESGG